jgi:PIN domain nuclease of toxin-antitoxin system
MKYLLDTHAAIWWWCMPKRLSRKARRLMEDTETQIFFSAVSAYEIGYKHRLNRLPLPASLIRDLAANARDEGWLLLPLGVEHAQRAGVLDNDHRDPFDRLLAAQAESEKLPLITNDPAFESFDIKSVWR